MKKIIAATPCKWIFGFVCFLLFSAGYNLNAQTLSFPGAMGFGAHATGGRGGTVYHVTTLADSGPGSFRDAVSKSNRIVVFDVGGYISLASAVSVKSNITIAGQTAPGEGIGFKGGEISFAKSTNIICRYIRIRPGSETGSSTDDCLSFYRATNIIVDHLSLEFAPWNNIDGVSDDWQNYPVKDITVQNSLIADPTGQQFGAHTEAVAGTWSWFNNIFANSHNRNPLAKINTIFVNNVLYNCSAGYTTHTSTPFKHDIVNNYFIIGPASGNGDNSWFQIDKNQSIYYNGNLKDTDKDGTLNGSETTPYWYQGPGTILTAPWTAWENVTLHNTQTAYHLTTSQAGTLPRDPLDALILSQVETLGNAPTGKGAGTAGPDGGLYTSQAETGLSNNGYGDIQGGSAALDSDNDGMPDYWEKATGSDPNTNDAMTVGSNGYALIEQYFNWLADLHALTSKNSMADIDLTQFTNGFASASPVYSVTNATNGTVSLQADGHTARFTPTTDFTGLGSFSFTVTGTDGSTYTATVTVVVSPMANPGAPAAILAPSNVTLSATSSETPSPNSTVVINWNDNSGNEDNFVIERSLDGNSFTDIAHPAANATTYSDNAGLLPSTTYYYRIKAVNATDKSAYSTAVSVKTPPLPTAPAAVTSPVPNDGFQYAALSSGKITLQWNTSANAEKYLVYMGTSAGSLTKKTEVTTTSYEASGLLENTTYYWRIDAANTKGTTEGDVWSFKTAKTSAPGLIGYWSFDETGDGVQVFDSSQYRNHGVLGLDTDNPDIRVAGHKKNAIDFATLASDAYGVSIPDQDQLYLDKGSFSISFWMKADASLLPSDNSTSAYLLCKGSIGTDGSIGSTGKRFDIEFKNKILRFAIDDANDANGGGKDELQTDGTPFYSGDWMHVVAIRDTANKKLQIYLNGELVKETGIKKALSGIGESSALILGNIGEIELKAHAQTPSPYRGQLDEVKMYNYVLSNAEIITLFYGSALPQKAYAPNYNNVTVDGYSDTLKLKWKGGVNGLKFRLFLGTNPNNLSLVSDSISLDNPEYAMADVPQQTTYYWRADAVGALGTSTGDVWSFTTGTPKGLVAHYAFDETSGTLAADSTAFHNNATLIDMPNAVWMEGKYKNALGFGKPGSTGAVVVPDAPQIRFGDGAFTVSMWLKLPAYNTVSGKYDCYLFQKGTMENVAEGTGKWYGLQLKDKTLTFAIDDGITKASAGVSVAPGSSYDLFNKGWMHVVALRDPDINRIRIYINGVLAKSVDESSVGTIGKESDLLIGNSPEEKSFPDSLDDVRIYNYALSEALINKLYNNIPLLQKVSNPTPANQTAGSGPEKVVFKWDDKTGTAQSYNFYFGTSPDSLQLKASSLTTNTFEIDSLPPSTNYYWRVQASSDEETVMGDKWLFTSGADVTAPTVITKDVSVALSTSGNVTISPADVNDGSNDVYGIDSLGLDKTTFTCSNLGDNVVNLTVKDKNGNLAVKAAKITVNAIKPAKPMIAPGDTVICVGDRAQLTASTDTAVKYQWFYQGSAISGAIQNTFNAYNAGRYTVIGISAQTCASDTSGVAIVRYSTDTTLTISNSDTSIFKGASMQLAATGSAGSIVWSPSIAMSNNVNGTAMVSPENTTRYVATLTNTLGCEVSRSVTVTVMDKFLNEYNKLLTPDGDGVNDQLKFKNLNGFPNNRLQIFDYSGKLIYQQNGYNNDWDGRINGHIVSNGTYYFVLMVNNEVKIKGSVSVVH